MFPPNSYTGEDLAELQIHGSNAVINALLGLSEQENCRLAEPGEFTKIAFQNDKIDLLKAESKRSNSFRDRIAKTAINKTCSRERVKLL